ncbi:MAG: YkgJ family cysteine cluster protein [Planctomycetota bacterium]|jgi:Fe-S-cluster containining protein
MEEPRPEFPFRFRCRRSGNCCARPRSVVRVHGADVRRIASHLGMAEQAFRDRYVRPAQDHLVDGPSDACVFLEAGSEAACSIYAARPEQCRTWPYWEELRNAPAMLQQAMRLCPGIEVVPAD